MDRLRNAAQRAQLETQGGEGLTEPVMSHEEKEARAEMLIEGVIYSLPVDKATQLGWTMAPPVAGSGNDRRVLADPSFGQTHRYVKVADVSDNFAEIPIEGYSTEVIGLILSNVLISADQFAADWVENGWYESAVHVGPLAEKATVIEGVAGFPSITRSGNNSRKQACWRLVSFINESLLILGKTWEDTTWLGHPAVPGQLLAVVQAAMELAGIEDRQRPASTLPEV